MQARRDLGAAASQLPALCRALRRLMQGPMRAPAEGILLLGRAASRLSEDWRCAAKRHARERPEAWATLVLGNGTRVARPWARAGTEVRFGAAAAADAGVQPI